jgi:hypothetical protein
VTDLAALCDELEPIVRKADEWAHEHPDEWDDLDIFPDDMPDALADILGLCTPAILGDLLAAARRSIELEEENARLRSAATDLVDWLTDCGFDKHDVYINLMRDALGKVLASLPCPPASPSAPSSGSSASTPNETATSPSAKEP